MNWQTILTAISLLTASMILMIGVVLLTGFFLPVGISTNYRYTLGAVMTLYASYRIGIIWYKAKKKTNTDRPDTPGGGTDGPGDVHEKGDLRNG